MSFQRIKPRSCRPDFANKSTDRTALEAEFSPPEEEVKPHADKPKSVRSFADINRLLRPDTEQKHVAAPSYSLAEQEQKRIARAEIIHKQREIDLEAVKADLQTAPKAKAELDVSVACNELAERIFASLAQAAEDE